MIISLSTGKRLDVETTSNKNDLPIGTILQVHGYCDPRYVIIENLGINERFPHYGTRYRCINMDSLTEIFEDAYCLNWENDGTMGIRTEITSRPIMIPSEIEAIKAKVKDADIRRKQAAEQEKAEKERQRLEYETSPEYAHLTQAQNTEKWGSTLAAMNIRADLKKNFPGVKFSVKSERYSGGDSVNVYWTGGPDEKDVENVIDRYEAGSFDGMTDSYTYKKSVFTDVFGETKYLFCTRKEIA